MLDAIRHPRRRTISIGPQSEADAYEMMAVRERRRRESRSSQDMSAEKRLSPSRPSALPINEKIGQGHLYAPDMPMTNDDGKTYPFPVLEIEESLPDTHIDDQDDQALFAKLQTPRVRYDVEVVTKLVVYAGSFFASFLKYHSLTFDRHWIHCRRYRTNLVRIMRSFHGRSTVVDR